MSNFVEVNNLTVELGGRKLLQKLHFSIQSGKLIVVLGQNGAGKSTLLRALTGDLSLLEGEVYYFGQPLNNFKNKELAQKRSVLTQQVTMGFSMEVWEVVLLGRHPYRELYTEKQNLEIVEQCLKKVNMLDFMFRNYSTLSGGEQQRIQFARCLAQLQNKEKHRVLFLDEPTASLDIAHQHHLLKVCKELCDEGVGVFAIIHDLNLAAQYADEILILKDGAILALGSPEKVLTAENLSNAYSYPVEVMNHPINGRKLILN